MTKDVKIGLILGLVLNITTIIVVRVFEYDIELAKLENVAANPLIITSLLFIIGIIIWSIIGIAIMHLVDVIAVPKRTTIATITDVYKKNRWCGSYDAYGFGDSIIIYYADIEWQEGDLWQQAEEVEITPDIFRRFKQNSLNPRKEMFEIKKGRISGHFYVYLVD